MTVGRRIQFSAWTVILLPFLVGLFVLWAESPWDRFYMLVLNLAAVAGSVGQTGQSDRRWIAADFFVSARNGFVCGLIAGPICLIVAVIREMHRGPTDFYEWPYAGVEVAIGGAWLGSVLGVVGGAAVGVPVRLIGRRLAKQQYSTVNFSRQPPYWQGRARLLWWMTTAFQSTTALSIAFFQQLIRRRRFGDSSIHFRLCDILFLFVFAGLFLSWTDQPWNRYYTLAACLGLYSGCAIQGSNRHTTRFSPYVASSAKNGLICGLVLGPTLLVVAAYSNLYRGGHESTAFPYAAVGFMLRATLVCTIGAVGVGLFSWFVRNRIATLTLLSGSASAKRRAMVKLFHLALRCCQVLVVSLVICSVLFVGWRNFCRLHELEIERRLESQGVRLSELIRARKTVIQWLSKLSVFDLVAGVKDVRNYIEVVEPIGDDAWLLLEQVRGNILVLHREAIDSLHFEELVRKVNSLEQLEHVCFHLESSGIRDKDLEAFADLRTRFDLRLENTRITDRGLETLKRSKKLMGVYLEGSEVTGHGVDRFLDGWGRRHLSWFPTATDFTRGRDAKRCVHDWSENAHSYELIQTSGVTWEQARQLADSMSHNRVQGHLATITSQEENEYLFIEFGRARRAWVGASDETTEGVWKWTCGPESGEVFFRVERDSQVPLGFVNWKSSRYTNEPDNRRNEDYLLLDWLKGTEDERGHWTDVRGDKTIEFLIVEYSHSASSTKRLDRLPPRLCLRAWDVNKVCR